MTVQALFHGLIFPQHGPGGLNFSFGRKLWRLHNAECSSFYKSKVSTCPILLCNRCLIEPLLPLHTLHHWSEGHNRVCDDDLAVLYWACLCSSFVPRPPLQSGVWSRAQVGTTWAQVWIRFSHLTSVRSVGNMMQDLPSHHHLEKKKCTWNITVA